MPDNFNYYRGNLVEDPELRFTPNGHAVANFRIAVNRRIKDSATGEWKDADALFLTCNAWRDLAENAVENLTKGQPVMVMGELRMRSYETKEGEKRTVIELEVEDLGPSLKWKPKGQQTRKAAASYSDEPPF